MTKLLKGKAVGAKCCHHRKRMTPKIDENEESNKKTMVNISHIPLAESEIKLLSRGLSVCPKPSQIDQFQFREDVKQFFRRLRLREFFNNQDNIDNNKANPFKRKSKWTPPINRKPAILI